MKKLLVILLFMVFGLNAFSQEDTVIDLKSIYKWIDEYEFNDIESPLTRAIIYLEADGGFDDSMIECGFALVTDDKSVRSKAFQVLYVLYIFNHERFVNNLYYHPSISELLDPEEVFKEFKHMK